MIDPSEADSISQRLHLNPPQTIHRIHVLNTIEIKPGSRILEIGCGQGDCTGVIAHAIGPSGRVDAVDPAPLDYGSPATLGQMQGVLKDSDVGDRITFIQADPIQFLGGVVDEAYDVIVLCHSLWYFGSEEIALRTMEKAKGKAKRLLIAEWALASPLPNAQPHIFAALTRGVCEAHIPNSNENIRSPFSISTIKDIANTAGWIIVKENVVRPDEKLQDASWEINMLDEEFVKRARQKINDENILTLLNSMQETVRASVREVEKKGDNLRCMDVWVGVFDSDAL